MLPLLTGEMASSSRGRGHELHSLREYVPTDSARFVDWKVSAKSARLMVREFAREDERRVMLVFDPFIGPPRADLGKLAEAEHAERFERAVSHGRVHRVALPRTRFRDGISHRPVLRRPWPRHPKLSTTRSASLR